MMYGKILGAKKIFYIFIILIIIFIIFNSYKHEYSIEFGLIMGMITFIYGFFINSIFGFVESKYALFKSSMADMSAYMQSIYQMSLLTEEKEYIKHMRKKLINLIIGLKDVKPELYETQQFRINELFQVMKYFNVKDQRTNSLYSETIKGLYHLSTVRERLELFGDKYIVGEVKFLFFLYPILISSLLIVLSWHNFYQFIIALVLIIIMIFSSQLILDMDDLSYGAFVITKSNLDALLKEMEE